MPGLDPGIHVFASQNVDGRDKPGHDDARKIGGKAVNPTALSACGPAGRPDAWRAISDQARACSAARGGRGCPRHGSASAI
ncbi:hypothetical protein EHH60_19495 [Bradyrhizobium sp. RP6]|nr:hypothetical protein EHH60_19495 [Bradyrhizobium sp. RP6]